VYGVEEGRPFYKLRPLQLLVTVVTVALCVVGLVILLVSGPVARAVGNEIGIGDTALQLWNIAKWPALAVVVILVVALLYYVTPNVRQPRFRWISPGAFVAILVWVAVSVGFAFYVGNFSSYNKTYGSVAGGVVALLWLWLTNLALLFGAELDAELERGRELQAGMPAEKTIQLPLRDDRNILKARRKRREDAVDARELRARSAAEEPASGPGRRPVPDEG
jgi:membrane protein